MLEGAVKQGAYALHRSLLCRSQSSVDYLGDPDIIAATVDRMIHHPSSSISKVLLGGYVFLWPAVYNRDSPSQPCCRGPYLAFLVRLNI